ncbi:MAG: HAMP domain-containing protein [Candidatus Ozemobacteraceae bacterium]
MRLKSMRFIGIIPVIFALWMVADTFEWRSAHLHARAVIEADERNQAALSLLGNKEVLPMLLEDRLEAASHLLSELPPPRRPVVTDQKNAQRMLERGIFYCAAPTASRAAALTRFAKRAAARSGIKPVAMIWMDGRFAPGVPRIPMGGVGSYPIVAEFGFSAMDRDFFEQFLRNMLRGSVGLLPGQEEKTFEARISSVLGSGHMVSSLQDEQRGRCISVVIGGSPYHLFWRPLIPTDFRRLPWKKLIDRSPYDDSRTRNTYQGRAVSSRGGILWLVPRPRETGRSAMARLMREAGGKRTALMAIDPTGRFPPLRTQLFKKSSGESLLKRGVIPAGWAIASTAVSFDRTYHIYAATRISGKEAPSVHAMRARFLVWGVLLILVFAACSGMIAKWSGTSTAGRIALGLGLAAVIPLALIFSVSERISEERFDELVRREGVKLRRDLIDIERRHLAQRAWFALAIRNAGRDQELASILRNVGVLENSENSAEKVVATRTAPSETTFASVSRYRLDREERLRGVLKRFFSQLSNHPPIDLSMRYSVIVTDPNLNIEVSLEKSASTELLGQLMGIFGRYTLEILRPSEGISRILPVEKPVDAPTITRGDLTAATGKSILASMFGPDAYFSLLHLCGEPLYLTLGYGSTVICERVVPSLSEPRALLMLFYQAKHTDMEAIGRILGHQGSEPRVVAFTPDILDDPPLPEVGEDTPLFRRTARRMSVLNLPMSMRIEENGRSWLVEAAPSRFNRQFLFVGRVPLEPIREEAGRWRREIRFWVFLAFVGAVFLAFSAVRDLSDPLRRLMEGMRAVEKGNFASRVVIRRGDELESLGNAFNQLARGLEEGKTMARMVSGAARRAMESAGDEALARHGRRGEATILFILFTGVKEALSNENPVTLIEELSRQAAAAVHAIEAAGGDVDKLLGEKILAVFPHDRRSAREAAVAAAETALILAHPRNFPTSGRFPAAVGIASGTVILGLLGAGARRDFTVIGDPVNTAARIAAQAAALNTDEPRVLVPEAIRELVSRRFQGRRLPPVQLKGKAAPVSLVQLIGPL